MAFVDGFINHLRHRIDRLILWSTEAAVHHRRQIINWLVVGMQIERSRVASSVVRVVLEQRKSPRGRGRHNVAVFSALRRGLL